MVFYAGWPRPKGFTAEDAEKMFFNPFLCASLRPLRLAGRPEQTKCRSGNPCPLACRNCAMLVPAYLSAVRSFFSDECWHEPCRIGRASLTATHTAPAHGDLARYSQD